ncbi:hypothetical protein TNCV_278811 [Trichonephila clavipes]|nr:hypothetical protein TNCV_278811 [Trichonephila clavipes]
MGVEVAVKVTSGVLQLPAEILAQVTLMKSFPIRASVEGKDLACSYMRAFGNGHRNFETWSIDEDDTSLPFLTSAPHQLSGADLRLSLEIFNLLRPTLQDGA